MVVRKEGGVTWTLAGWLARHAVNLTPTPSLLQPARRATLEGDACIGRYVDGWGRNVWERGRSNITVAGAISLWRSCALTTHAFPSRSPRGRCTSTVDISVLFLASFSCRTGE